MPTTNYSYTVSYWAAAAQWGEGFDLQPQGRRFDPRSPH